jgi:hypothetical protein
MRDMYKYLVLLMQRDGARLVKTACDDGIARWSLYPFGIAVHRSTAGKILARSDVRGMQDGLLPDLDQTFAIEASSNAA